MAAKTSWFGDCPDGPECSGGMSPALMSLNSIDGVIEIRFCRRHAGDVLFSPTTDSEGPNEAA